jgi:hypothetical protein
MHVACFTRLPFPRNPWVICEQYRYCLYLMAAGEYISVVSAFPIDKKEGTGYSSGHRLNVRIDDVHEQTQKGENLCVYYLFIHLCIYEIQYSHCIAVYLRKLTFVCLFPCPTCDFAHLSHLFNQSFFSLLTRLAISRDISTNQHGQKIRWESCRFESQKLKLHSQRRIPFWRCGSTSKF